MPSRRLRVLGTLIGLLVAAMAVSAPGQLAGALTVVFIVAAGVFIAGLASLVFAR